MASKYYKNTKREIRDAYLKPEKNLYTYLIMNVEALSTTKGTDFA